MRKKDSRESKWYDSPLNRYIREKVAEKDFNMREFANKLRVTDSAVRAWCSGYSRPDLEKFTTIADYFNVTIDFLMGRTTCPSTNITVQGIHDVTGLSVGAIETLAKLNREKNMSLPLFPELDLLHWEHIACRTSIINMLLENEDTEYGIFEHINAYFWHRYRAVLEDDDGEKYYEDSIKVYEITSEEEIEYSLAILSQLSLMKTQECLIKLKDKAQKELDDEIRRRSHNNAKTK